SGTETLMQPTIVLVHGAFAESASWSSVIDLLVDAGQPRLSGRERSIQTWNPGVAMIFPFSSRRAMAGTRTACFRLTRKKHHVPCMMLTHATLVGPPETSIWPPCPAGTMGDRACLAPRHSRGSGPAGIAVDFV